MEYVFYREGGGYRCTLFLGEEVHDARQTSSSKKTAKRLTAEEGIRRTKYALNPIPPLPQRREYYERLADDLSFSRDYGEEEEDDHVNFLI